MERDLTLGEALDLACQFAMMGRHEEAIGLCRGVLMHEPENFEAIERLGASLFELKRYHEALYHFWRGRRLKRRDPMALTNYGLCIGQLGHWDEAIAELEKARYQAEKIKAAPEVHALIWNNLGNTLEKLGRYEDALKALDKGLSFNPDEQFAHYNRGIALLRLNRHEDGIAALDRAIHLKPSDADALYNRGIAHLLLGNLKQGLDDYEARLTNSENERVNFGLPAAAQWNGEDLTGKTILVHGEQGLGDYIQFFRFFPQLIAKAKKVLLVSHKHMVGYAKSIDGLEVLDAGTVVRVGETYDYWVAMMSLPKMLGIAREADIPPPWLPELDRSWCGPMPQGAPNVGIVWAGNFLHKNDAHRSIPLSTFASLFDAPVNFVSLQQMRAGERDEFKALKETHGNLSALLLDDLRDTAAVIKRLDLVVSVDTAVAHLSASLGVPTFVLIPKFNSDWRWQLSRTDTAWYPTMRLYRQDRIGDWHAALERVRNDLRLMAQQRAA